MNYSKNSYHLDVVLVGFTIFSMFFGASNFILPIMIIKTNIYNVWFSFTGFLFSSILLPTIALIVVLIFKGDYKLFLAPLGNLLSKIFIIAMMALFGSFGSLPRCISLTYEMFNFSFPSLNKIYFIASFCFLIFILSIDKVAIVNVIGKFLTPLLLMGIFLIIIIGLIKPVVATPLTQIASNIQSFNNGLKTGALSMDLFSSLLFAGIITPSLLVIAKNFNDNNKKLVFLKLARNSTLIGMSLLMLIYLLLFVLAKKYFLIIKDVDNGQLVAVLADNILGKYGALISSTTVGLACLTTSIALAVIFTEFVRKEIFKNTVSYKFVLAGVVFVAFFVAMLGVTLILELIQWFLIFLYPVALFLLIFHITKYLCTKRFNKSIS